MEIAEKTVIVALLFAGFLWIRFRARASDMEKSKLRTLFGIFVILPAILIGIRAGFDRWHFGPLADLFLKVVSITAAFAAVGFVILKPAASGEASSGEPKPPEA